VTEAESTVIHMGSKQIHGFYTLILQLKKMSSSKPGAKSSETAEKEEDTTTFVEEKEKSSYGIKENGNVSSESESKNGKKRKFPSKPSNGLKEKGKESSESEPKKRNKRLFPSKEEISKARLDVFSVFDINLGPLLITLLENIILSINL